MGIWDRLLKKTIAPDTEEDIRMIPASNKYRQKIYERYYKDYPVKPFISKDREVNSNWLEQAEILPKQSIIPIAMMTKFPDDLLPGHIYLLYWIDKSKAQKQIPGYFEYKYGINFSAEKIYLIEHGYLSESGLTDKGINAITEHNEIVENHSLEATTREKAKENFLNSASISVEQQVITNTFKIGKIYDVGGRDLAIIGSENRETVDKSIEILNKLLNDIRKELKLREKIQIPADRLIYNKNFSGKLYTYLEYTPLTPTGKTAKYPITLHFAITDPFQAMADFDCFGSIGYFTDHSIGKAVVNIWFEKIGYHIEIGIIEQKLSIKRVDHMKNGKKTTIYYKK